MADMTGRTLGKYRLTERLGRGGMAEVYRAYQPSLEREVAIKVMHGYLAEDEGFVGRFKREARAVATLRHPHIVQVYDFDIEDDTYYMVMEYIGGETLKARLKRFNAQGKRMPLEEVVRIFRALCDALDYAHAQGRIHRDIKPANIMFDGERLVLTDFGIASIVGGTRYTATGAMIGTPAYMSPEQGQGEPGDVRSDVYALGVILYEMVAGRVPYDADTPLAIVLKLAGRPLPVGGRAGRGAGGCCREGRDTDRDTVCAPGTGSGDHCTSAGCCTCSGTKAAAVGPHRRWQSDRRGTDRGGAARPAQPERGHRSNCSRCHTDTDGCHANTDTADNPTHVAGRPCHGGSVSRRAFNPTARGSGLLRGRHCRLPGLGPRAGDPGTLPGD